MNQIRTKLDTSPNRQQTRAHMRERGDESIDVLNSPTAPLLLDPQSGGLSDRSMRGSTCCPSGLRSSRGSGSTLESGDTCRKREREIKQVKRERERGKGSSDDGSSTPAPGARWTTAWWLETRGWSIASPPQTLGTPRARRASKRARTRRRASQPWLRGGGTYLIGGAGAATLDLVCEVYHEGRGRTRGGAGGRKERPWLRYEAAMDLGQKGEAAGGGRDGR